MVEKVDYSRYLESPEEFSRQSQWWSGPENHQLCEEIAQWIPPGSVVCDAGAGSGEAIPIWYRHASKVIAVDACELAVSHIHSSYPFVDVYCADLRNLNAYALSVDVVICKSVLKHFGPEWRDILRQLCGVARSRVIFTMGVDEVSVDRNPDVPYYDWAEPPSEIFFAIPSPWRIVKQFGNPLEPVFVCDRKRFEK